MSEYRQIDLSEIFREPQDGWKITHRCDGVLRTLDSAYHGYARVVTCSWCRASIEIHITDPGYFSPKTNIRATEDG